MKVGNESVVIGQINVGATIGDRSVVIGATDSFGNTTIREGAYGYGAKAAPGSVAIGANADATTSNWVSLTSLHMKISEVTGSAH